MAGTNQSLKPKMGTFGDQVVDLQVSFQMNGASDPTATSGKGIYSVTRNSQGLFTVVLQGKFIQLLSCTPSMSSFNGTTAIIAKGVNASATAKLGTDTATGFSTVAVTTLDAAGAVQDETAATYTWVSLNLQLSLSPLNT
jgi:hypothetical protein